MKVLFSNIVPTFNTREVGDNKYMFSSGVSPLMTAITGVLSSRERKPLEYDAMLYAGLLPMLAIDKILKMSLVSRSPQAATSK